MTVCAKCQTPIETPHTLPDRILGGYRLCEDCGLLLDHVTDVSYQQCERDESPYGSKHRAVGL